MPCSILDILPQPPSVRIVDVGAMICGQEAYRPLLDRGCATVIGFEPVREECERLNREMGAHHVYLPYVIGDGRKYMFHLCNYPMTSSLLEPNPEVLERFGELAELTQVVATVPVNSVRLDDIEEIGDADYLKMDVQGAEVIVLDGAPRLLEDIVVVHTEAEFVPMYRNQPLFSELDQALRRHGFWLHRIPAVAGRALRGSTLPGQQMLWCDAVYIRRLPDFERLSPSKLLKLAVILHEVYGSADFAAFALQCRDAQTGERLAPAYLELTAAAEPRP